MQNEKDFFYHYNVFEYTQDFVLLFHKIVGALMVFAVLKNIVYLYLID